MNTLSQDEFEQVRNGHRRMYNMAKESIEVQGRSKVWDYKCPAIKERYSAWEKNFKKVPAFDIDYIPNPFQYQYDMELDIFLNYEDLRVEAIKLDYGNRDIYNAYGPTMIPREEHLLNAIDIRWPTRIKPSGEHSGLMVRNPWLEDTVDGIAKFADNISFGGGGQGKTYGALAFQCMTFDHFIHTKAGAQCTFSTVSQSKMDGSTWPYVNKLYPVLFDRRKQFSLYAGLAEKAPDYTFRRIDLLGKKVEIGGKFVGVLLAKGMSDSRVVDKLTGSHDPILRTYLLDEAQSTDGAPLSAYTNMFLHPLYGWFFMSGNYATDTDLLGINIEPNIGWENVTPETHRWEGTLKSVDNSLNRASNVLHFNNDLSPGMMSSTSAKRWTFLPNQTKKTKLYPNGEASKDTIEYKRFWTGWRFEKQDNQESEYVLTNQALIDGKCAEEADIFNEPIVVGSFDTAPASRDRNLLVTANVGLSSSDGLPLIDFNKLIGFKRAESHLVYYRETTQALKLHMDRYGIKSGHIIMDWSAKSALIEMLNEIGIVCHFIIYHGNIPNKKRESPYDKSEEDVIELETIKTFSDGFEKKATVYAHEKVLNQQALGAYAMRLFIESGRVRNFGTKFLSQLQPNKGWDKEMMRRKFIKDKKGLINLDDKDIFIKKYHFSTDVFDVCFQLFYMLYVKHGLRPGIPNLGKLQQSVQKPKLEALNKLWTLKVGNY